MPEDAVLHENGIWYREFLIDGLDDKIKLFNSLKPYRLEGETQTEYKIRRKFLKVKDRTKYVFYTPVKHGFKPYININKKEKFKK